MMSGNMSNADTGRQIARPQVMPETNLVETDKKIDSLT